MTENEVADYLEEYVSRNELPVRHQTRVKELNRDGQRYRISVGDSTLNAKNVIVATGLFQESHIPAFAKELDPAIFQSHSNLYCKPEEFPARSILALGKAFDGRHRCRLYRG